MSDTPKEIQRARVGMQFDHPFFGYLALTLECVERPDMKPPTMGTDGRHLFYHPDFIKKISQAELQGVIAHEIMHCVLKHLPRCQGREPVRFNIAADLATNPLVLREFKLPTGVLNDPAFYDKAAEWIYSNLPINKDGSSGRDDGTLDSHEEWKNWGKPDPNSKDKGDANGDGQDIDATWSQNVAMAATQAKVKGKLPAHLETVIGELLQPKLNWKALLTDRIASCAKNDYHLSPHNKKHLWRGFYLPSIAGEEINIACAVDTSGSISDQDMKEFLSEIKGICDAYDEYTIHLFTADAAIQQRWELHSFDKMPTVMSGRGGTDFRPVIEEVEKLDVTSLVYFTDMDGRFPPKAPNTPVIWVSTGTDKAPFGSVIQFPRENQGRRRY
jgi:predicted metal-dependent peptidase